MNSKHVAIVGPTASGKSALALALAEQDDRFEIVSVDSMQVYRGMDIGTAKATPEEQRQVPHHLIDLVDANERFTISQFQQESMRVITEIESRGKHALFVGGTGLYLNAVLGKFDIPSEYPKIRQELESNPDTESLFEHLKTLDPDAAAKMEPTNRRRIIRALEVCLGSGQEFSSFGPGVSQFDNDHVLVIGLWMDRSIVNQRIDSRYGKQIEEGFVEEVKGLLESGMSPTARQALGYREIISFLEGELNLDEALAEAARKTKAFARRQRMWFRRIPDIVWMGAESNPLELVPTIQRLSNSWLN